MKRSSFLVVKGGESSEKDISLRTAECVEKAFDRVGIRYRVLKVRSVFDVVSSSLDDVDYVFNALHGGDGENGVIQGILDLMGVSYNGAGREASTIGLSKILTKAVAVANSVAVPKGMISISGGEDYNEVKKMLGALVVVKPDGQGCSLGVGVAGDKGEFEHAVLNAKIFNGKLLYEEFVCGEEITVSVLDGEILPFLQIIHTQPFFDFEAKFNSAGTQYKLVEFLSADVDDAIRTSVRRMCEVLDFGRYARFDFIIKDDVPYLLEINTLPGLNSKSVFVKACLLSGVDYDEMICRIIGRSKV